MLRLLAVCNERRIAFPLSENLTEVTAGSLPDNAIYLPYKGISRRHFSLVQKEKGWMLQDLGSTNGTLLNGQPIATAVRLKPGDVIQAGAVTLHAETAPEDMQKVSLSESSGVPADPRQTDKLDKIPLDDEGIPFSFPDLVLPPDMILGKSAAMMDIYRKLHSIASGNLSILFVGETGTGKDFLARMVHLSSKQASGPFVAVNCAAIPSELVEAELFGIGEKVATNVSQRKGKMAAAEGGTLFLDELGAFPFPLQSKILRAVEERAVTAVGETRSVPVHFRLLSATNEDPQELIRAGRLREDLYHRVAGVEILVPPLRERKEDLEILIPALLRHISAKENKRLSAMSKRLFALLLDYSYPGNLRELLNILKAMVALSHPGEFLDVHLVPEKLFGFNLQRGIDDVVENSLDAGDFDLRNTVDEFTRQLILRSLKLHDGNIPQAAAHLKVTSFGLRKMMKRLGIAKPAKPSGD